jgi:hypothetical protein
MPIIDRPILSCEVSGHGRHDDPIFQFQISDSKRTEEGFELNHANNSRRILKNAGKFLPKMVYNIVLNCNSF